MEMNINLVEESFKFMILGMGVVFSFLVIMIFVLKGQASLLTKFFPQKEKDDIKRLQTNSSSIKTKKVAAIVVALQHHNNQKG